jgi:hypothetical protein
VGLFWRPTRNTPKSSGLKPAVLTSGPTLPVSWRVNSPKPKPTPSKVVVNITEEMNGLKAGNQRLIAERDAALKDANRYRFLRSEKLVEMLGVFPTPETCDVGLDHQIDTAMEASK